MRLLEDEAKARLAAGGVPIPRGGAATTPDTAGVVARTLGSEVVVKALVPANRRSKEGGVLGPLPDSEVAAAARELLGAPIAGFLCEAVYVEEAVTVSEELYLAFSFGPDGLVATVSTEGGIYVEEARSGRVDDLLESPDGLTPDEARRLWRLAGAGDPAPPGLIELTVAASTVFTDDATIVELNPVAITTAGDVLAVGGLIEMDDAALFRHPEVEWRPRGLTAREAVVAETDHRLPGPSVRYVELDGDIGLLVGGGGAGLYQHDLLVKAGVQPANHSDIGAGVSTGKLDVLIEAVLGHPNLSCLLVGYNLLQMARCDIIVERILAALDRFGLGDGSLPVVMRLDGLGADRARRLAAGRPGLKYLPSEASLAEGVRAVLSVRRPWR